MTSEQQAFLNAIIAKPDDDLPRLVYADWLEEHGGPERARFIRQSCWDKHGGQYTGTAELVRLYRPHVILPSGIPNDVILTVHRGFVHSVHVPTLEVWRGGVCGRCRNWMEGGCSTCKGSGRISGIGRELCKWNPVQEVRAGNKEPLCDLWYNLDRPLRDPDYYPESDIPGPLFKIMERLGGYFGHKPGICLGYDTTADANRYWSQALILEARQEGGAE